MALLTMKSINIYTFPKIILKILENGKKGYILCKDKDEMRHLDNLLWTFSQLSFLPHATEDDEYQKEQNLLLMTKYPVDISGNKFLVLTSENLFLQEYIFKCTRLFIITTQAIDIQNLIDIIDIKTDEIQIKYFHKLPIILGVASCQTIKITYNMNYHTYYCKLAMTVWGTGLPHLCLSHKFAMTIPPFVITRWW